MRLLAGEYVAVPVNPLIRNIRSSVSFLSTFWKQLWCVIGRVSFCFPVYNISSCKYSVRAWLVSMLVTSRTSIPFRIKNECTYFWVCYSIYHLPFMKWKWPAISIIHHHCAYLSRFRLISTAMNFSALLGEFLLKLEIISFVCSYWLMESYIYLFLSLPLNWFAFVLSFLEQNCTVSWLPLLEKLSQDSDLMCFNLLWIIAFWVFFRY